MLLVSSQEVSLFPFPKIVGAYLQNIHRGAFLFRLRIGTLYHKENFLITGTSNSRMEQDLGSKTSYSNCNSFSLVNTTCGFALS